MPIYAYRCDACGFAKDVLQKISDAPLTDCPECGKAEFKKQLTAAGFQLKGTGWYVTDFRNGGSGGASPKTESSSASSTATPAAASSTSSSEASSGGSTPASANDSKPASASN
ncbi:MAG: hypothetical protein RL404_313 [Pseudomonadota bacterium]|jgi:putative FmdB family regulatory protein